MNCPNCQIPIAAGDMFCGECGYDLTLQDAPVQEHQPAALPQQDLVQQAIPTRKLPIWLIGLIIVFVIVSCICIAAVGLGWLSVPGSVG